MNDELIPIIIDDILTEEYTHDVCVCCDLIGLSSKNCLPSTHCDYWSQETWFCLHTNDSRRICYYE